MNNYSHELNRSNIQISLGDEVALSAKKQRQNVDNRQLSLRWMLGVLATGVSSLLLMGGALTGALDGQQTLAKPGESLSAKQESPHDIAAHLNQRGNRVFATLALPTNNQNKRELEVATSVKQGDREVIQTRTFVHVKTNLAVAADPNVEYPRFNALSVFADKQLSATEIATSSIYGAEVDSPVTVTTSDLTEDIIGSLETYQMSLAEAELIVRENAAALQATDVQLSAVAYIAPSILDFEANGNPLLGGAGNIEVLQDNVSEFAQPRSSKANFYDETVFSVAQSQEISAALQQAGFSDEEATSLAPEFKKSLRSDKIGPQHNFKLELERNRDGQIVRPMRISAWEKGQHLATYARRDDGALIQTKRPVGKRLAGSEREENSGALPARMPTIYDGIYRAVLGRNLPSNVAKRLISIFGSDVDFQTRVGPRDKLELFYTGQEDSEDLDVLHARIQLGKSDRRYYRFITPDDGKVDYYDETGKSARKFLIRKPLPGGKFRSGFGMRRHPVLKYSRMHTGVDWSAPRGTPIVAAGSGKVTQAKWAGGYGRQTLIQHANGYVTSYSHQTRFARGVKVGARVRQGQVIGYVGSTGLSTGPHLHYEVIVNGRKVNPMKIRLPQGRILKGEMLAQFMEEKARIDELLGGSDSELQTASIAR